MSDFDKEAERERLREKYEAEREGREATQRMSELLLKGATMTNQHCGSCGDPVFRHDGTEFCPSCNASGERAVENAEDADDVEAAADAAGVDVDAAAGDGASASGGADASADAGASAPTGDGASADAGSPTGANAPATDRTAPARREPAAATDRSGEGERARQPAAAGGDAAANVEATLERFAAAAAAETDDPGRARDCLAVVREAAETLEALRAVGR